MPSLHGRPAALAFIFVTVALDMLAFSVIIPVLPKLVVSFVGGDTAVGAEIFGIFGTAWAAMQFLCSPLLGALSDRFGRRPVILLSNLGLALDCVLMALAPNLAWLFVGRLISGMTAASISTAFAYIADVTPPAERAGAFGLVGTAFGLGFVLGPAVGGLLGGLDPRLPFWVAAGFGFANTLYGLLVLPESLPPEKRSGFSWARANPVGALILLRSRPGVLRLTAVNFLSQLAHVVLPSTFVLYAFHRYGWDERSVGLTLAGVGICSAIVQGGFIRPVIARLGEPRTMVAGLACGCIGFTIYGLAATGLVFLLGIPVMALWGLAGPATQGLMTRQVDASEQGRLQGAQSCVQGIAGMVGPGLFTFSFAAAVAPDAGWSVPGTPFYLAALLLAAALALAWPYIRAVPAPG